MSQKGQSRLIGGILLVSGTAIGAGMLALPVVTGLAGFVPALFLFIVYWLFMTFTALLILEVTLWMNEHANLVTMARKTLGKGGAVLSWIVYLFLLYTLTTAYIAGSGPIIADFVYALTGWQIPIWLASLPFLLFFGFFVCKGTDSVDYINRILMLGLIISYFVIVIFLTPHASLELLEYSNWNYLWVSVSIVSTSFGFHIIIPTLSDYLRRDQKQLKKVILIGSFISLLVYTVWNALTLGIVPLHGTNGIIHGFQEGLDGATLLSNKLSYSKLSLVARFFSFFAIITSFLGVSLSLSDFLADGLKIKKTVKGRAFLYLLTFLPPLLFTLIDPRAFLNALEYAGAFGVVLLLAVLPILMVWRGRYIQKRESKYQAPGGKPALILVFLISLIVIGLEIANKTGMVSINLKNYQNEQVTHE